MFSFAELEKKDEFPNGLHDALLRRIDVDYVQLTAAIFLDIDYSGSDVPERKRRPMCLTIEGMAMFIIEPPGPGAEPYQRSLARIDVGDGPPRPEQMKWAGQLPADCTVHYLWNMRSNSVVVFAGRNISYSWIDV